MTATQKVALGLLVLRIGSVGLMLYVLKEQIRLLRENNPPDIQATRWVLFILASVIFAGNFVPILIDVAGVLQAGGINRPKPLGIGVAYSFSNAVTALIASGMFFMIYHGQKVEIKQRGRGRKNKEVV